MMSFQSMLNSIPMAGRLKEAGVHFMTCMCMSASFLLVSKRKWVVGDRK